MNSLLDKIFGGPAAALQARVEAFLGVSVPLLVCLLFLLVVYVAIAAAAFQACVSTLGGAGRRGGYLRRQQLQVCLLGPSGSGKTRCLLALRNGRASATVPSIAANRCEIKLKSLAASLGAAGSSAAGASAAGAAEAAGEEGDSLSLLPPHLEGQAVRVVDFPGHQRLRPEALATAAASALLIFFVDAADKPSLKGAAEFLFDLFCHPKIQEQRPPLLIVANKRDTPEARGQQAVIEDLERELERCRVSRQVVFEGEDAAESFIGFEGKRFALLEDAPCPVEVCSAAVAAGDLSKISQFIISHAA